MILSDDVLLSKIETQLVYCDKKSHEEGVSKVKWKYKIAGNILKKLEIYAFFIVTTDKYSNRDEDVSVEIEQKHWEGKDRNYLKEAYSYVDLRQTQSLTGNELCYKMRDSDNKFPIVARLCDVKYSELRNLRKNIHKSRGYTSLDKQVLVDLALQEVLDKTKVNDDILKRLGLD